jgi:hypothetical protein
LIRSISILILFFTLCASSSLVAQRTQRGATADYTTEFVWGITKNTASGLIGGITVKHSKQIKPGVYRMIGAELVNVKHPNEVRLNSIITGNFFIWAKEIYLYAIRGQYGREYILFKKAPQQGIQINAIFAGGPSIGLKTPYYIEISSTGNSTQKVPYESGVYNFDQILGTGNLFQGLFKSGVTVGLNLKASLAFEFGSFKSNVTGIELGFLVDSYIETIEIVPAAQNTAVFPTAFITFFYGSRR